MARIIKESLSLNEGTYLSLGSNQTAAFGKKFSSLLPAPCLLALFGDLGAGKTTFVKGLVEGLGGKSEEVQSPTFVYLNCYEGMKKPLYHFDLYRIQSPEIFLEKGFEEFFSKNGICVLEWAERIFSLLPEGSLRIQFEHVSKTKRLIRWSQLRK